jgi:hypothetical protein
MYKIQPVSLSAGRGPLRSQRRFELVITARRAADRCGSSGADFLLADRTYAVILRVLTSAKAGFISRHFGRQMRTASMRRQSRAPNSPPQPA